MMINTDVTARAHVAGVAKCGSAYELVMHWDVDMGRMPKTASQRRGREIVRLCQTTWPATVRDLERVQTFLQKRGKKVWRESPDQWRGKKKTTGRSETRFLPCRKERKRGTYIRAGPSIKRVRPE